VLGCSSPELLEVILHPNQTGYSDRLPSWYALFIAAFVTAYLYVFMEWLFLFTGASFMDAMSLPDAFEIFLSAASLIAGVSFALLCMLFLASQLLILKKHSAWLIRIGVLLPSIILSILILLLVDNFTYTIFKFGIMETGRFTLASFLLSLAILFVVVFRRTLRTLQDHDKWFNHLQFQKQAVVLSVMIIFLGLIVPVIRNGNYTKATTDLQQGDDRGQRPNILLLTSDGLNANHLSVYGYKRNTSPNLKLLAENSLLAENAYTNSEATAGSIISIFTSKPSAKTRVIYPPNILQGQDSYQHLPGILRSLGYRTIQVSARYYTDAYQLVSNQ